MHLKSFHLAEAYKTASDITLTTGGENKKVLFNLLKDQYGKKESLIRHFKNKLLKIQPVKFFEILQDL